MMERLLSIWGRVEVERFVLSTAEFARQGLPARVHEALIRRQLGDALICKDEVREPKATRLRRQSLGMSIEAMLADLSQGCDIGRKRNSQGFTSSWAGYKLHLDVADGMIPNQAHRFKQRSTVERANARLEDDFGLSRVNVRGATKIMTHMMFAVLALSADQRLRLII